MSMFRLGLGLGLTPDGFGPAPLGISGTPVLTAVQDLPYTGFFVTGGGGLGGYTYSVGSGTLPTGISLNSATGEVSGTPTIAGVSTGIVLRVTDGAASTADLASFDITVASAGGQLDFSDTNQSGFIPIL